LFDENLFIKAKSADINSNMRSKTSRITWGKKTHNFQRASIGDCNLYLLDFKPKYLIKFKITVDYLDSTSQ